MDKELRTKLLEAVVKLRLRDCLRQLLVDTEKVAETGQRVLSRLRSDFYAGSDDPCSDLFLSMIEGEIELEIVKPQVAVSLACLRDAGDFDLRYYVAYEFIDPSDGLTHYGAQLAREVHASFPFSSVTQAVGLRQCIVSDNGTLFLQLFAQHKGSPEVRYEIVPPEQVENENWNKPVEKTKTVPAGWGLSKPGDLPGR